MQSWKVPVKWKRNFEEGKGGLTGKIERILEQRERRKGK